MSNSEIRQVDHREHPRCEYHPDIEAETECDECGKEICGKDIVQSGTKEICNVCFEKSAGNKRLGVIVITIGFILPVLYGILVYALGRL